MQARPYFIRRVEDYDHLKKEESVPQTHQVLNPEIAQQMLGLLQEVVQSGTATAAKSLGRPLGGKPVPQMILRMRGMSDLLRRSLQPSGSDLTGKRP